MDESLTLVMVPVLSEQMTDTAPRVSTVLRDLHRILFFLIMLATMVRDDVRAIGSPSGMKATAALTQDTIRSGTSIQLEWSFLSHAALNISEQSMIKCMMVVTYQSTITKITTHKMKSEMISTNLRISFCNGVIPVLGSLVSFAMRPNIVLSPIATTTPRQLPDIQCVPWTEVGGASLSKSSEYS